MATRINTNIVALNAHANILRADLSLQGSIERLSSGMRINRAADDPAGLVISEGLRAQVTGLTQAINNSNDSINMIRTAEGALTEIHNLLRSMRALALHASNTGVNDQTAIQADQQQISSAISSIDRIASQTQFGNVKLLDGTIGTTYTTANPAIVTGVSGYSSLATTGMATVIVSTMARQALATGTQQYLSSSSTVQAGTVIINGTNVGTFTSNNTVQNVVDAINAKSSITGVSAALSSGTSGFLVLKQNSYGSDFKIQYSDTASIFASSGASNFTNTGVDAAGSVVFAGTATLALNSGKGLVLSATGGTFKVGLTASATAHTYGNAFQVTAGSATYQIGANAGQTTSVGIDSVASSRLGTTVDSSGVGGIDVTTSAGAASAIAILDAAISEISALRGRLGAFQKNVLESNISSLTVARENVMASESSVRDTDMALEVVNFTRSQIVLQAATAMLAQANSAPQAILSLLRG
jgi:flagellin